MKGRSRRMLGRFVTLLGLVAGATACGIAQGINIDLDVFFGDPALGNGAPSSSFGGAAEQPGFWNRVDIGSIQEPLIDVSGRPTSVVMTVESSGSFFGIGFRNKANTGDFALLLNDAVQVGALGPGGSKTYSFSGPSVGIYRVYTYAVHPAGHIVNAPVHIEEASKNPTQIVTGPMPGNSFEYLVTHSIHEVDVGSNGFSIYLEQPPAGVNAMHVNGFQIAPVPEPVSLTVVSLCCLLLLIRKRCSH